MLQFNIEEKKQEFLARVTLNIKRPGIEKAVNWLENESDFFTAPASTKHHLCQPGGLCLHSLNTDDLVLWNSGMFWGPTNMWPFSVETAHIAALFHDTCKANFYKMGAEYPASDAQLYTLGKDSVNLHRATPQDRERFMSFCYENGELKKDLSSKTVGKLIDWLKKGCSSPMPDTPIEYRVEDQFPAGHGAKSVIMLQKLGLELTDAEILAIVWHMGIPSGGDYGDIQAYNNAKKLPLVTVLQISDIAASAIMEAGE